MVPKDVIRREGRGRGSREREESGKCTFFFFVVGAHARAIVCLRVSHFQMEIRHPSQCVSMCTCTCVCMCVCICILLERVTFICVSM